MPGRLGLVGQDTAGGVERGGAGLHQSPAHFPQLSLGVTFPPGRRLLCFSRPFWTPWCLWPEPTDSGAHLLPVVKVDRRLTCLLMGGGPLYNNTPTIMSTVYSEGNEEILTEGETTRMINPGEGGLKTEKNNTSSYFRAIKRSKQTDRWHEFTKEAQNKSKICYFFKCSYNQTSPKWSESKHCLSKYVLT